MDSSLEIVTQLLKSRSIRPSVQRVRVLHYLHQAGGHPTVEEIHSALAHDIPSLSKVTVYNTLHTLMEAGLVHVVEIDDAQKHYDVTLESHGHFLCQGCGKIFNFQVKIEDAPVEGLGGFHVLQKNVYFKGICPNCRNGSTTQRRKSDERGK